MSICLISFAVTIACAASSVYSLCNDDNCGLGASCQPGPGGSTRCVCPTFPCTPELGSETVACGDDDVTYANVCELRQTMCERQKWIEMKHEGPCGKDECVTERDCLYGGRCILGKCVCTKCRDVIDRRVYYRGGELKKNPAASRAWKRTAVCGTDDVTYESVCHLNYRACESKEFIFLRKRGLCRHERQFIARSLVASPQVNIVQRPVVESAKQVNCSSVQFKHCVSRKHRRLPYMGTYDRLEGEENLGSPVYKLVKIGSTDDLKDLSHVTIPPVYLSRHVTELRPNGFWIVGSKVGSGRGWLGVPDPAPLPEGVTHTWQATMRDGHWVDEESLSLECNKPESYECLESVRYNQKPVSNWDNDVTPPTPLYVMNLVRPRKGKYRSGGKLIVELRAKKQWRKMQSYIIKLTSDRPSCGTPKLVGEKNRKRHESRCGGTVLVSKGAKRKIMKIKLRFEAPRFGCVTISANVLSATGQVYEDDILAKRVCSKKT